MARILRYVYNETIDFNEGRSGRTRADLDYLMETAPTRMRQLG